MKRRRCCHWILRLFSKRFFFSLLSLSTICFILATLSNKDIFSTRLSFIRGTQEYSPRSGFVVDTPGCRIPDLDPFDNSIRHLFSKTHPVKCNASFPMTYTDGEWLRVNQTALKLYYPDRLKYCEYQEIIRPNYDSLSPDNTYFYNKTIISFNKDIKVNSSFIRLACYGKKGDMIYSNFHAFILLNRTREAVLDERFESFKKKIIPKETMNLVVLGIDAVSRLNFFRQMPKTRRYLIDTLKAIELKGMNKVADNTFVNIVPMFAGKFVEELPWDEMKTDVPFDRFPFLWKNFSLNGYRTLFAEDAPKISIFNYGKEGFHEEPMDYYLRPFSLALEEHGSIWNNDRLCVRSKQETEIVIDYLKDFMNNFKNKPLLAFSFITRLTHDNLNKAGLGDQIYFDFFKWMFDNGYFDNTAVIFFSDHGIRFGPIRETFIGKMEERLPMAYVIMPVWFRNRYPGLYNNLKININRLSTPFDFYETMKDILLFNGESKTPTNQRGISLFSMIPNERTCKSAGILPHWCTCYKKEWIDVKNEIVIKAALYTVKFINGKIHHDVSPCATLKLKKIRDALKLISSDDVLNFKQSLHDVIGRKVFYGERTNPLVDYLLTFQVEPGDGLFEATVRNSVADNTYEVIGDISRINAYGDHVYCMPAYHLQKYCHCL